MSRVFVLSLVLVGLSDLDPSLSADTFRVKRNIVYVDHSGEQNQLDVFAPAVGEGHPVVIWVHGGGWRAGDKSAVHDKPRAFTKHGYLLVSINYRIHPDASYREQGQDIAAAIRWVQAHIAGYGGDPQQLFLMGHSAGAHLAALVAVDERYLSGVNLEFGAVRGVILLDGAGYDIPRQIRIARLPRLRKLYATVFTEDQQAQRDASPITHVAPGKSIPPFLILHVASRPDSKAQSQSLAEKLNDAGVAARIVAAEGKTHATINRELGRPGDVPTREVFDFLRRHTGGASASGSAPPARLER